MSTNKSSALDIDLSNLAMLGEGLVGHLNAIRESTPVFWSDSRM
jgi:hypothetical protein